jgi:hypothetical protein
MGRCRLGLGLVSVMFGCGGVPPEPTVPAWKHQALSLEVNGFSLDGDGQTPASWQGSGVWLSDGRVATNAHVALRSLSIEATDDTGNKYALDRIVALDEENDLAILATSATTAAGSGAILAPRPGDPRDLRGSPVMAVGNTDGQGLSVYSGRIVNVLEGDGPSTIWHDAQISFGSSGGPLYDANAERVLGIDSAINPVMRTSIAVPSWVVDDLAAAHRGAPGRPLTEVFRVENARGEATGKRQACLEEDEAVALDVTAVNVVDLVFAVGTQDPDHPFVWFLVGSDGAQLARGAGKGQMFHVRTMPRRGVYRFLVGNPVGERLCLTVGTARVAWEKAL